MTSVLRELPLSYAVLSEGRQCGSASAVHEPSPAGLPYRASSIAPAGPSARATPPRRSPESSTPRVRLHLKPGQKGTNQLLAQYGDRFICVRYCYGAQRKKRFKTVELLVAEHHWDPPPPRFARDRVKQAGGAWNPERRLWLLRYDRVVAPLSPVRAAFLQELRALGYVDGQNITIEYRRAEGNLDRLPDLAAELVLLRVDVIFAPSPATLDAARSATKTIPIIMVTSRDDPIRAGLIESLARPGGNITGVTPLIRVVQKQLELLKEALPGLSRLGVVRQAPFGIPEEFEDAVRSLGLRLVRFHVRSPDDFNSVFDAASKERVGALHIAGTLFFSVHRKRLADLALKHRLPTVALWRDRVEAGFLMSYGPNLPDLFRRAAHHVDKILKGVKPAVLPVEQPTKFDLVINMKTAKALGLTVPPSVLLRADQVIE